MEHTIKKDGFYSISEILEYKIVSISNRSLQIYAKKHRIRTIDNSYRFTGHQVLELKSRYELRANKRAKRVGVGDVDNGSLLVKINAKLKAEIEKLKEKPTNEFLQIIKEIDNDDYVLSVLNAVKNDKHLEDFTDEEYIQFRDRLKEANALKKRIAEYKAEIVRMEEYVLDYRNNIEYLKKSLDRRADETAIILKSIEQRNFIEAKEKKLD